MPPTERPRTETAVADSAQRALLGDRAGRRSGRTQASTVRARVLGACERDPEARRPKRPGELAATCDRRWRRSRSSKVRPRGAAGAEPRRRWRASVRRRRRVADDSRSAWAWASASRRPDVGRRLRGRRARLGGCPTRTPTAARPTSSRSTPRAAGNAVSVAAQAHALRGADSRPRGRASAAGRRSPAGSAGRSSTAGPRRAGRRSRARPRSSRPPAGWRCRPVASSGAGSSPSRFAVEREHELARLAVLVEVQPHGAREPGASGDDAEDLAGPGRRSGHVRPDHGPCRPGRRRWSRRRRRSR